MIFNFFPFPNLLPNNIAQWVRVLTIECLPHVLVMSSNPTGALKILPFQKLYELFFLGSKNVKCENSKTMNVFSL